MARGRRAATRPRDRPPRPTDQRRSPPGQPSWSARWWAATSQVDSQPFGARGADGLQRAGRGEVRDVEMRAYVRRDLGAHLAEHADRPRDGADSRPPPDAPRSPRMVDGRPSFASAPAVSDGSSGWTMTGIPSAPASVSAARSMAASVLADGQVAEADHASSREGGEGRQGRGLAAHRERHHTAGSGPATRSRRPPPGPAARPPSGRPVVGCRPCWPRTRTRREPPHRGRSRTSRLPRRPRLPDVRSQVHEGWRPRSPAVARRRRRPISVDHDAVLDGHRAAPRADPKPGRRSRHPRVSGRRYARRHEGVAAHGAPPVARRVQGAWWTPATRAIAAIRTWHAVGDLTGDDRARS